MSDSKFKTKEVVVKGICPEEDITDIQSELENEGHEIRTVYRSKKSQAVIHIHYKIKPKYQNVVDEKQHKNENTAIKLDRLTFQESFTKHNDIQIKTSPKCSTVSSSSHQINQNDKISSDVDLFDCVIIAICIGGIFGIECESVSISFIDASTG
ncbi:hypothetical protein RFI_00244 [Reticulomyxa filosa]|uniref:Uncharacterized protein n=1 Tax=Reticulomyxa filosa TaxID=46433 RepID=X6PFC8_RETFI|nr:hypothetical protein RFI_00244 [Reticulomyxa filosa]|eukprot:ETO36818.1 hypothetical protein RFI_00244 [Reticulomyxa filosa]